MNPDVVDVVAVLAGGAAIRARVPDAVGAVRVGGDEVVGLGEAVEPLVPLELLARSQGAVKADQERDRPSAGQRPGDVQPVGAVPAGGGDPARDPGADRLHRGRDRGAAWDYYAGCLRAGGRPCVSWPGGAAGDCEQGDHGDGDGRGGPVTSNGGHRASSTLLAHRPVGGRPPGVESSTAPTRPVRHSYRDPGSVARGPRPSNKTQHRPGAGSSRTPRSVSSRPSTSPPMSSRFMVHTRSVYS